MEEEHHHHNHKDIFKKHLSLDELLKSNNMHDIVNGLCSIKDNVIILDYTCFKCFGANETYETILNLITGNIDAILKHNETFTVHVNMKHLTMSDVDKHKKFICVLSNYFKEKYPCKLNKCYIHNAPTVFSQIYKIISCFIDKETQKKIHLIQKS